MADMTEQNDSDSWGMEFMKELLGKFTFVTGRIADNHTGDQDKHPPDMIIYPLGSSSVISTFGLVPHNLYQNDPNLRRNPDLFLNNLPQSLL